MSELDELIAEQRAKCRESESTVFDNEDSFKYSARMHWWEYLQKSQKLTRYVMPFREFWGDESSYPRTIAENVNPVSLAK